MGACQSKVWLWPLLGVLGALLLSGAGCDPGHNVTYVNRTPYMLWLYDAEDRVVTKLEPFETNTGGEFEHLWTGRRVARTGDGRVVFSVDLTWDELRAQDYRIVIEEQGIPAPMGDGPTAAPSEPSATPIAPG